MTQVYTLNIPSQYISFELNLYLVTTYLMWPYFNVPNVKKFCQWLAAYLWFSSDILVSSINKTDRHYIYQWNIVESGIKHVTILSPVLNLNLFYKVVSHKIYLISYWSITNVISQQILIKFVQNMYIKISQSDVKPRLFEFCCLLK